MEMTAPLAATIMTGACLGTIAGTALSRKEAEPAWALAATGAVVGGGGGMIAYIGGELAFHGINGTINAAKVITNCLLKEPECCSSQIIGENLFKLIPTAVIVTGLAATLFSSCFNRATRT